MKYIMFEVTKDKIKIPVIFPDTLVHRHVGGALKKLLIDQFGECSVASAGTVNGLNVISVSGMSETLKVQANPDDVRQINNDNLYHGLL